MLNIRFHQNCKHPQNPKIKRGGDPLRNFPKVKPDCHHEGMDLVARFAE